MMPVDCRQFDGQHGDLEGINLRLLAFSLLELGMILFWIDWFQVYQAG